MRSQDALLPEFASPESLSLPTVDARPILARPGRLALMCLCSGFVPLAWILAMTLDELSDHMIAVCECEYPKFISLLIECVDLFASKFPPIAQSALRVAKRYWLLRTLPAATLQTARIDCWKYLDERSASTNTQLPQYCAIRAVICLLYVEQPCDDLYELVSFFNEMLQGSLNLSTEEEFTATVGSAVDRFSRKR